jgi:hypothetical protein
VVLYGVAALFGALSLLTMTGHSQVTGLVMVVFAATTWVGLRRLAAPELATLQESVRRVLAVGGRDVTQSQRAFERNPRFAQVNDVAGLWEALVEECRRLGVCGVELRLVAAPNQAATSEVQRLCWEAPTRAQEGEWSWSIPLSGTRGAFGELRLRCTLPGLAPPEGALLQGVARDVERALERLVQADSRSQRVS